MSDFMDTLAEKLVAEYGTPKTRNNGVTIQNLLCDVCGDRTAWAYVDAPYSINCNKGRCGARVKTRDLFPDLFNGTQIEKNYPSTSAEPHRPARVYLESRRIHQALEGLEFQYWKNVRKLNTGAVMFPVRKDNTGKLVFNGRLINPPSGEGKSHNAGSTSGLFWTHPGRKIDSEKPVFITEGIIDALSLIEAGFQAVAVLSAGQDPSKLQLGEIKNIVTAFDSDPAGIRATKKWRQYFKEQPEISVLSVFPETGEDWNSLLQELNGKNPQEYFQSRIDKFKHNGRLLLADSPQAYVDEFFAYKSYSPGLFEYNHVYFFSKPIESGKSYRAVQVSDFTASVEYFQVDRFFPDRPEYQYCLNITSKGRPRPVKSLFNASELTTAQHLAAAMMKHARCAWSGSADATKAFYSKIVQAKAPEVLYFDGVGLHQDSSCFLFKDFGINKNGQIIYPVKGLFHLRNEAVRPLEQCQTIMPKPGRSANEMWLLLFAAWGDRAAVAMAFMIGSWYVKSVRNKNSCFPFLSLTGDTQTGKTALVNALTNMQCINEVGLSATGADTIKGLVRDLSQKFSLFTQLSEINRDNKQLPIDSILTWYDGSPLATRGAFTNGKETVKIPFEGSIIFTSNDEPFINQQQKERVISIYFSSDKCTEDSLKAFIALQSVPIEELAHFFVQVMDKRKEIETSWFDEYTQAKTELFAVDSISSRIVENHALILSFHRILTRAINIQYDLKPYIISIMKNKQASALERETNDADLFFNELSCWLRECRRLGDYAYQFCVSVNVQSNTIRVHVNDTINSLNSSRVTLMKIDVKKLTDQFKRHKAYIKSGTHRFKFKQSHGVEDEVSKWAWSFDLNKLSLDVDFNSYMSW